MTPVSLNANLVSTAALTIGAGALYAWLEPNSFATKAATIISISGVTVLSTYLLHNRLQRLPQVPYETGITHLGLNRLGIFNVQRPGKDLVSVLLRIGGVRRENGDIVISVDKQDRLLSMLKEYLSVEGLPKKDENGNVIFSLASQIILHNFFNSSN